MIQNQTTPPWRIGELASPLDLNPKTIRYYESIGLLPAPQRTEAQYRLYNETDRERLQFIRKARTIGLTLQEIRDILALYQDGQQPCAHVLDMLNGKLRLVDEQLEVLAEFRSELVALRDEAAQTMTAEACVCAIVEEHQLTHSNETMHRAVDLVHRLPHRR